MLTGQKSWIELRETFQGYYSDIPQIPPIPTTLVEGEYERSALNGVLYQYILMPWLYSL